MKVACLWFDVDVPVSKLAELFWRFSPQIALRGNRAIFIEIGKCSRIYSEESFKIRSEILLKRNGYRAHLGIGTDITDSLLKALFKTKNINDLPLIALLELADPFDRDFVLRKSVQNLINSFQDLGIKTLGQFKRIPASELLSRFGIVGRHCHNRAQQLDLVTWPQWRPEETIQERKEFPFFEFYGELEPILFELKSQLDKIFARLFSRRKKLMKLQVQISCEKISIHPHNVRVLEFDFYTPQSSSKGTLRILKERLTREFEKRPILSPIEMIESKVLRTVATNEGQKNIFDNVEEKMEEIYSIHNQLIELLGKENIYQAVLTEDRRPEKSWRKKYDNPHEVVIRIPKIAGVIPERTTFLCRYPIKIEVTAGYVHIKKKKYRILNWDNQVEIITGGWYEKPNVEVKNIFERYYYHVELEGHQKISVFETPAREYFLHGYYG